MKVQSEVVCGIFDAFDAAKQRNSSVVLSPHDIDELTHHIERVAQKRRNATRERDALRQRVQELETALHGIDHLCGHSVATDEAADEINGQVHADTVASVHRMTLKALDAK